MRRTSDGGYIVCGSTGSFGNGSSDIYLVKVDAEGTPEWSLAHGGPGVEQGWMVEELPDGGYLVAGTTASYGAGGYDGYLLRVDAAGSVVWERTYGTSDWEFLYGLAVGEDRFYLVGTSFSGGNGGADLWTLCVSEDGVVIWEAAYGNNGDDEGRAVFASENGGCIVAGTRSAEDGSLDAVLVRYDDNGGEQWDASPATDGDAVGNGVTRTTDGAFVLGGWCDGFTGLREMLLWKVDEGGEEVWMQHFGESTDWEGHEVKGIADGGVSMAGWTAAFGGGGKDMYLLVVHADGAFRFGRTFGSTQDEEARSLDPTPDGGFVVAGSTRSYGPGNSAVFVVKTDSMGFTANVLVNEYADPLAISGSDGPFAVFLFPVPVAAGGRLHLERPFPDRREIWVHDAQGRSVGRTLLPAGASSFVLPGLPSGPYVATILGGGRPMRALIIVE